MMLPKPKYPGVNSDKKRKREKEKNEIHNTSVELLQLFTFRTNSSACSAALCANAPKSISSDNTPAFKTSVI